MGAIPFEGLLPSRRTMTDEAREVGAMPVRSVVPAVRVGYEHGVLTYLRETPIYVATVWRSLDAANTRYSWWRLEVKVDAKSNDVRAGDDLVLVEHPYGSAWLHHSAFKSASKKSGSERADFSSKPFSSLTDLLIALENSRLDYWEKGNFITVGISAPDLPFDPADVSRNVQRNALYVFGSCEDFKKYEEDLLKSEKIKKLVQMTEKGTLKFWAPDARLSVIPELLQEVRDEAWSLMCLSVRQALAGPHRDSEQWIGRAVWEKVDDIYRGHINRRNRQLSEEQHHLSRFDEIISEENTRNKNDD